MPGRLLLPVLALCLVVVPSPAVAAPTVPTSSPWSAPLDGGLRVTRPFDPPPDRYGAGHRGTDLAGAPGRPVLAAGDGVVVFAGMVAGRRVVSIDHPGGLRTTYEPVDPSVAAGQPVARGSPIGTLAGGHAGCPVSACLHWGLRRGETYLDPMRLVRPVRVRLLPLGGPLPRSAPGELRPWDFPVTRQPGGRLLPAAPVRLRSTGGAADELGRLATAPLSAG
jgi:murein DD-endopeptidase MepM/ murein hydrolase activator NlpD